MNVTVVGTGYVGLVTGTCLAEVGNHVHCIDTDADKIDGLKQGKLPIHEPGLDRLVEDNLKAGRIEFGVDIRCGVEFGEIVVIAVGTPPDEDGSADLSHVLDVARSIGRHINSYRVVVNKSTVPVGTADRVRKAIAGVLEERGVDIEFDVVSNPEFLKEGAAVEDFMKPDRIIVGVDSDRSFALMHRLYEPFNRNHDRMIRMDIRSAELTKYAANAMLATKISFMNEMANLAEMLGADIESVRNGIGADPRIGYHFIYPGCGYGGSCFPKDVRALRQTAGQLGYHTRILEAVEQVNNDQKQAPADKLLKHFGNDLSGLTIALWGLSFKPNTDDMREASSRVFLERVGEHGAHVRAFDPVAMEEAARLYKNGASMTLAEDPYSALDGADALVLITEWKIFRALDLELMKQKMRQQVIVDGRNLYDPELLREAGFIYYGIGRR